MLLGSLQVPSQSLFPILGVVSMGAVAVLFSENRRRIKWRSIGSALLMQVAFGLVMLKTAAGLSVVTTIAGGVEQLYGFAEQGARFVFGSLVDVTGPWGMIFGVKVIPIIIFFGALMAVLFHFGIIQLVVQGIAFVIRPVLGTSGAETLCAVANSMLGQTEAPLLIKNYLPRMTRSEMMVVMVSGMATLSGSIMAVYGSLGVSMQHLLTASVMAIPGSIWIAKILCPETEPAETSSNTSVSLKPTTRNVLDAISTGTTDGMMLAVNVAAMLITFVSLIALVNALVGISGWTLDQIFGYAFSFVARLIGIDASEAVAAGTFLGQKLVINEFVAYSNMTHAALSPRTTAILTYALAGFANFSCIGIQIGGIGALAPAQRHNLIVLGLRALLGATLTNLLNAAIISQLL